MRKIKYILLAGLLLFVGASHVMGQTPDYSHDVTPTGGSFTWAGDQYGESGKTTLYTLQGTCTVTKKMTVVAGTVIFDLNGFTFTSGGDFNMFEVKSGATLIIRDTKSGGGGTISGGEIDHTLAAIFVNGGTFNLTGGTITNFKQNKEASAAGSGCAVYINGGGVFNMSGGTISDCGFNLEQHYGEENGAVYIKSDVSHKGGAVYVTSSTVNDATAYGKFNFTGGTIDNCTAYRGGAVYVDALSYNTGNTEYGFHMGGGTIQNCIASNRGGAVYVEATDSGRAYFSMSGGTIQGCKARNGGCGVYVKGVFEMTDGTIKDNVPKIIVKDGELAYYINNYEQEQLLASNAPLGGGICAFGQTDDNAVNLTNPAILNISGGTISGNVAASGGGVMANNNSVFTLSNAVISGNHAIGYRGTGNGGAVYANNATFTFNGGTLSGNKARRYGGAININAGSTMTLSGTCTISGNQAGHGGGISQEAGECSMELASAGITIENNTAIGCYEEIKDGETYTGGYNYTEGNGGGLFIERGTLTISGGKISGNKANGSGGGIALRSERLSGDITLEVSGGVEIKDNIANYDRDSEGAGNAGGNGGGVDIYSLPSDVTPTVITANISGGALKGNKADNGGGISVYINSSNNEKNSASISLGEGANAALIESNTANANGGGLYVFNNTAKASTVAFSGGSIQKNTSPNGLGGGICVEGLVNLTTTGTNVKNNEAKNGGGIYLSGGAAMTFNGGLICNNEAEGTPVDPYTTAYQNDAKNAGVGGGIYLAANSKLNFFDGVSTPLAFGVYGNTATTAADDIFATGSSTSIQLPKVSGMALDGFDVPTSELYWVEDYVTADASYASGTNVKGYVNGSADIVRYRYALNNFKDINKIDITDDYISLPDGSGNKSYVCLALGYEQYFVNLVKVGLEKDDSAIFKVSYLKNEEFIPYRTILFHRKTDDANVKASIVLTAGTWKFEEDTNWSGKKYELSAVTSNLPAENLPSAITDKKYFTVEINSDIYQTMVNASKKTFDLTITNTSTGTVLPPTAESAVTNSIPTLVSGGQ